MRIAFGQNDAAVTEAVHHFLECITEAFTDLAAVADGGLAPIQLRGRSLLGSVGTLRVLAGVYNAFTQEMDLADEEITEFLPAAGSAHGRAGGGGRRRRRTSR